MASAPFSASSATSSDRRAVSLAFDLHLVDRDVHLVHRRAGLFGGERERVDVLGDLFDRVGHLLDRGDRLAHAAGELADVLGDLVVGRRHLEDRRARLLGADASVSTDCAICLSDAVISCSDAAVSSMAPSCARHGGAQLADGRSSTLPMTSPRASASSFDLVSARSVGRSRARDQRRHAADRDDGDDDAGHRPRISARRAHQPMAPTYGVRGQAACGQRPAHLRSHGRRIFNRVSTANLVGEQCHLLHGGGALRARGREFRRRRRRARPPRTCRW